jgi:uncharacterized protein (TIGR00290 family)
MKVFSSWSGGKECALATYKAICAGHEVCCLLNFISEDGKRSRSHGVKADVLVLQAKAIGIPLIQAKTTWEDYEKNFKQIVGELKNGGIEGGVFGDIDVVEHREWVERVCSEIGIKALLPLWGRNSEELIKEFLGLKFRALLVATRLEKELLGRDLDLALVEQIRMLGAHPCGENGEYHTFVFDGPIFRKMIDVAKGETEKRDDVWFLEIEASLCEREAK